MNGKNVFFCAAIIGAATAAFNAYAAERGGNDAVGVVSDTVKMVSETSPKRYVGTVEAIEEVNVIPRVTGELKKVCFKEGSIVKEGDLLFELEDTTYRAAVDGLKAQKKQLEAALDYASTEYKRSTELLKSKAVAESSHDKALMEIDVAKAKMNEIDASLMDAENNLSYTRIHAAISGRIGKSSVTKGNLLTPGSGCIANIVRLTPIYVRFSLSENVFRRDFGGIEGIMKNAVIRVRLADGTIFDETGKVVLVDNKVSSTTNTVTLWALFTNAKLEQGLMPGSFVTVLVSVKPDKPIPAVVPSALIMEDDGCSVYVITSDNKVERRSIVPGGQAGELRTVLSGLSGNETIVVDGTHKVHPGDTVIPTPAGSLK